MALPQRLSEPGSPMERGCPLDCTFKISAQGKLLSEARADPSPRSPPPLPLGPYWVSVPLCPGEATSAPTPTRLHLLHPWSEISAFPRLTPSEFELPAI